MTEVIIYCEGETEETFVNEILTPYLAEKGIFVRASSCKGVSKYPKIRKNLKTMCRSYRHGYVTTMLDLYGIPSDTPGKMNSSDNVYSKVENVENEIGLDIGEDNFIPNLMLHEFEALLFSDPDCFSYCGQGTEFVKNIRKIRKDFETPEHINDNPNTAPSKRIIGLYNGYSKTLDGYNIAKDIGIEKMRNECRHFDRWIETLEKLKPKQSV